jgi:hypothetical protein
MCPCSLWQSILPGLSLVFVCSTQSEYRLLKEVAGDLLTAGLVSAVTASSVGCCQTVCLQYFIDGQPPGDCTLVLHLGVSSSMPAALMPRRTCNTFVWYKHVQWVRSNACMCQTCLRAGAGWG